MLRIEIVVFLLLFSIKIFSQQSQEESGIDFKDSLRVTYPAYFQVKSLDCFDLQALDTLRDLPWLPSNNPFLLYYNNSAIFFAIRENGGLSVWMHQPNLASYVHLDKPVPCSFKFESDTTIMIRWTSNSGMSSMDGFGNASHEAGFFIINLRRQTLLAGLKTYVYSAYWEKDMMEEEWESYKPKIEVNSITLVSTNESSHAIQKKISKTTPLRTIRYKLIGNELIREP